MSDATATAEQPGDEAVHDEEHEHASDGLYIKVAIGLAVLTAMEIAWPEIVGDGIILMVPLLVVMVIKFVIIAAFFMHLKFDSPILSRVFYFGLVLAIGCYLAALVTFQVFRSW